MAVNLLTLNYEKRIIKNVTECINSIVYVVVTWVFIYNAPSRETVWPDVTRH